MKKMFLMFLMVGALALPSVQAQVASNKTVTRNVRVSTLNNQKAQCPDGTTQTGLGDDYIICSGPAGPQGPVGPAGPQGVAGPTGAQGPQGDKGDKGDKGNTGAQGPAGPVGPVGATGAVGPQGASCSSENPACRGPQGPAGPAGVSVTGPAGPVGPQGIQGVQGPVGVVPVNPIQWIGWNVFNGGTVTDLVKQDLTVAELVNCYKQPVGLCGVRHGLETQLIVEVKPEFNPQYGNIVFGLEDAAGNLAAVYHTHSAFDHDGFVNGPVTATAHASFALPNVNHFFLKVDTTNVYYSENGKLWFSVGSVGTLQATSIVLGSYNGGAFIVESVNP